jgi:hypothetical protein
MPLGLVIVLAEPFYNSGPNFTVSRPSGVVFDLHLKRLDRIVLGVIGML